MAESNARQFIEALHRLEERGDVEAIVPLFDERAQLSNPTDVEPHVGREGAEEFWRTYRESFQRIHSEFRNVVESDRSALLEWHSEGQNAAGDPVVYDGVSVLEFEGGRIRRFRAYFDPNSLRHEVSAREVERQSRADG